MADLPGIAAILAATIPTLGSLLVAILQIRASKKQKARDELDAAREELRKRDDAERNKLLEKESQKIDTLSDSVSKLAKTVNIISEKQDNNDRMINSLTLHMQSTTRILMQHQQATAEALSAIAEGFRNSETGSDVVEAIDNYKSTETHMLQEALAESIGMNHEK